jgi:hypothetical protein
MPEISMEHTNERHIEHTGKTHALE